MKPPKSFVSVLMPGVALVAALAVQSHPATAASISRLNPPSLLFSFGDAGTPVTARFLTGQYFDLQATIRPDPGVTVVSAIFKVDGVVIPKPVALQTTDLVAGLPAGTTVATLRRYSNSKAGLHTFLVEATMSDSSIISAEGNFEVVQVSQLGRRAKNVIFCIGDGLGIAHRTAARIVKNGVQQGKVNSLLAMDTFPVTGLVMTHSLNSIITDSSPGAACYATGNKFNNNQQGVFPDDTIANFDNPRVELIGEYLARTQGKALGIVTTSDVFDATPGAFGTHTQNRGAGTGICDQYLDEAVVKGGLRVLLGGGRKWFLPNTTPGSARGVSTDYVLPNELVTGWGVAPGVIDPERDLVGDFEQAGFTYVANATELASIDPSADRLLGLFTLSNMNVALDKISGRRGAPTVVNQFGENVDDTTAPPTVLGPFNDQPMLDEMTGQALQVLSRNPNGFVLMVEGASIDKQAHNMDTERWILDTIEFDYAVAQCKAFAEANPDTLVIVTADHECAGINIIGASRVTNTELTARAASGLGTQPGGPRNGVVGTYDAAGFPVYEIAADGYPTTTDPDYKILIGYAANADRYEDWLTNPLPLRDSQQPFDAIAPLNAFPSGPVQRDVAGDFFVTGQIQDPVAAHTGSDIPVSAYGRGAGAFTGVMDNTDVFFKAMQAVLGGARQ